LQLGGPTPLLVAAPALSPVPLAPEPPRKFDWSEFQQVTTTPQLTRAASLWAKAYLADERAELLALTGDTRSSLYAGLGGFVANEVKVVAVVSRVDVDGVAVARVEIVASSASGWTGKQEYDLLVRDPSSGNPRITAWGPPGTGGALVDFENALNG
jgi:hypothetical protein